MRVPSRRVIVLVGLLVAALSAAGALAQEGGGGAPPEKGRGEQGGGPGQGARPKPPLERVLDANGDGTIDAGEMANAVAALKKLDANGDGKLTSEEYRPPRPPRQDGGGSERQSGGAGAR